MGITSKCRHDSPLSTQRKCKFWDPIATLDIINPVKGCLTCVGYAPSCRRRCWNPINQENRKSAFLLLEALSYIDTSITDIEEKLHELATLTLCVRNHQGQNFNVVQRWSRQIGQQQSSNNMENTPTHIRHTTKGMKECVFNSPRSQYSVKQENLHSTQEKRAPNKQGGEAHPLKGQEREHQQQEREKREEEKKKQKKYEEEKWQRKCKEDSKRIREQEAREREAREKKERNERVRRKAEEVRKERERKAKEQAEKEREDWDKLWLRYVLRWDVIKKNGAKGTSELRETIPWPVKSGNYKDVTGSAVEEFFWNAHSKDIGAEKMFALMKMECLKWHADRTPRYFVEVDNDLANLFNTVAQVAIKIRAEVGRKQER